MLQILFHDLDQCLRERHDLLIARLHVAKKHCPGGKVQVSDLQVEQRGRTAAGTKQEVDNDPIAVFGKGACLAVRFLQQLLQLVGGIGFLDRIIGTHQSNGILFQIAFSMHQYKNARTMRRFVLMVVSWSCWSFI